MSDEPEIMPGDYGISYVNIKRYRKGEDFKVSKIDGEANISIEYDREVQEAFYYYYSIWENYHSFGLPHNEGWIRELPWVLDFLKYFDRIFNEIEYYRAEKRRR